MPLLRYSRLLRSSQLLGDSSQLLGDSSLLLRSSWQLLLRSSWQLLLGGFGKLLRGSGLLLKSTELRQLLDWSGRWLR